MTRLCFVDTETTGLDPDRHEMWLPVDLKKADSTALRMTRYYDRRPPAMVFETRTMTRDDGSGEWNVNPVNPLIFWDRFARLTAGAHLVGAVPSFDEERLRRAMLRSGVAPAWHYHLVDVEALAAGALGVAPPWDSHELSRRLGVVADEAAKHTALGDARWARDVYDAALRHRVRGGIVSKDVPRWIADSGEGSCCAPHEMAHEHGPCCRDEAAEGGGA